MSKSGATMMNKRSDQTFKKWHVVGVAYQKPGKYKPRGFVEVNVPDAEKRLSEGEEPFNR